MLSVPMPGLENLTFTALYDAYYRGLDDKDGEMQAFMAGMPAGAGWNFYREDFGVGFRFDVSSNWLMKAEWHDIEGADLLTQFFNNNGAKKDWNYYIVKTSYNF